MLKIFRFIHLMILSASVVLILGWPPPAQAATDCSPPAQTEIPQAECEALVALYTSTNGPGWSDSPGNNWNVTNTPCTDWANVGCSGGHVISIVRNSKDLNGTIPDLSALTNLNLLYLYDNQLSGEIPASYLPTSLQWLRLGNNQLDSIPNLSGLYSTRS